METELIYYRRRSDEEVAAAAAASDGRVRSVHLELGRRYDERISTIEAELKHVQLRLVGAD
jgi:hypothetical protein